MTRKIHTEVLRDAHPYTRSKCPWIIDEHKSIYGKLIHYLSGGGMRTFGRTVEQEEASRSQRRFLAVASGLFVVWLAFWLM